MKNVNANQDSQASIAQSKFVKAAKTECVTMENAFAIPDFPAQNATSRHVQAIAVETESA